MSQHQEHGCHFTWEWLKDHLKNKPQRYIRDRMESLDREIEFQDEQEDKRDLPRLYTLKGFLTHRYAKVEGNNELLEKGKDFLEKALKECNTDNLGYKYVILSNLKQVAENEKKAEYANELKTIDGGNEIQVDEVHAMQAHAAGHFHLRTLCIEHYQKAGKSKAEWCFGLALVKEKQLNKITFSNEEDIWQIMDLLDEAIRLDSSYVEAKLKKAKILFEMEQHENAEMVLQEVLKEHKDSLKIKEGVAVAYKSNDPSMSLKLFKECYKVDNQRQKTLRGLGLLYRSLWYENKENFEHFKSSIKYQNDLVNREDNTKVFDLTNLATTLLYGYQYKKDNKLKKEFKKINDKIIKMVKDKQLNLNAEIETCYRIANFNKEMANEKEENEEINYLRKVLDKIGEPKAEYKSGALEFIKKARERLRHLKEKHPKKFEINIWVLKSEERFQEAIECLKTKEGEVEAEREKAACYIGWIKKEGTAPEKIRDLLKYLEDAIHKINIEADSSLDLIYESIPDDDDIKVMKVLFRKFIINLQDFETNDESVYERLFEEIKKVLDRTIHHLFMVALPKGDPLQNTFYPSLREFEKKKTEAARLDTLEKKLKGIFWKKARRDELEKIDLLEIIPALREFNRYFDHDKYQWYDNFHYIRNTSTHKPGKLVKNIINDMDNPNEIAIRATFYAACVFRFVKTII